IKSGRSKSRNIHSGYLGFLQLRAFHLSHSDSIPNPGALALLPCYPFVVIALTWYTYDRLTTVPFTGIRRIVNPGGSKFALCFSRVFLEADNIAFHEQFRVKRSCFESPTRWYALNTNLLDSQRQLLPQRLRVFLYILAWDAPQRLVAHRFRNSQSAVSSIFHQALQATMRLAKALITMLEPGWVSPTIELDPRL